MYFTVRVEPAGPLAPAAHKQRPSKTLTHSLHKCRSLERQEDLSW
jgi:hypothetical protein